MTARIIACMLMAGSGLMVPAALSAQAAAAWTSNAVAFRGRTEPIIVRCPPGGRPAQVWGTDIYTDDSSICSAAVHAGVINLVEGGAVSVQMRPGRNSYRGSRRNGIVSADYEEWEGSFAVAAFVEPEPPPPPAPARPALIGWDRTAAGLAPNGRRFTFRCPAQARPAAVSGVDVYSWTSSICGAAAHAGVILADRGGLVTIEMRPGLDRYDGQDRNGIVSQPGAGSILGFVVVMPGTTR